MKDDDIVEDFQASLDLAEEATLQHELVQQQIERIFRNYEAGMALIQDRDAMACSMFKAAWENYLLSTDNRTVKECVALMRDFAKDPAVELYKVTLPGYVDFCEAVTKG